MDAINSANMQTWKSLAAVPPAPALASDKLAALPLSLSLFALVGYPPPPFCTEMVLRPIGLPVAFLQTDAFSLMTEGVEDGQLQATAPICLGILMLVRFGAEEAQNEIRHV